MMGASISSALVDQLLHDGGRPHLADRSDLEHRVGGRLNSRRRIQHARGGTGNFVSMENGDACARDVSFGAGLVEAGLQIRESHP
jgi:hypothetical protein